MFKELIISIRALLCLCFLTGLAYPFFVTVSGQMLFSKQANGSLIVENDTIKGSELISQKFIQDKYFHSRPSSADFATIPSGASNFGPTSQPLKEATDKLRDQEGKDAPVDLFTTSGSGLDPHISPEAAQYQIHRIAHSRKLDVQRQDKLRRFILEQVEKPDLSILGNSRVNVLKLNLLLDKEF